MTEHQRGSSAPEFWLYLPQMRMDLATIRARAAAAEAAGFAGVALMDHLAPPGLPSAPMYDAMTTAAAVVTATDTLRVGHLCLAVSFRHPAVLAREVVGLDHLSGGRFELGVGWGSVPDELARFGLPDEDAATRAARLTECLEILRALFTGEVVDHEGRFWTLRGAQQLPVPLGHVPIVIGGAGPKLTMPQVARFADWWNCPSYGVDRLAELLPLAGTARVSTQHPVGLARTAAEVADVEALAHKRFRWWGGLVTGTPDTVAGRFAELAGRGVERFYVPFTDFAPVETIELFGREVIARF